MRLLLVLILLTLTACTTTKTIPVPVDCPKPVLPAPPHDYMGDLGKQNVSQQNAAPLFVRACLLTTEGYRAAYEGCVRVCQR